MFTKILIANRGEIACRIIGTCQRLGIATVAVYSDADANARHVRLADAAIHVGAAPARNSYLRVEAILEAARASAAEAIHPGYGFLSENADFAEACAGAGLVFIGPPPGAIRAMGSKSLARQLMARAGVPLVPGYDGDDQDLATLQRQADAIGYPVLIKASAGGGGKGMRVVGAPGDFAAALSACRREAASSFGDDRVLLEKYLNRPRHIEVQVFADAHGGLVHLFERDCSVQRRHQKVLEEAPAPGMTAERRAELGRLACEAARAVGYVGAGTVEFIVSSDGAVHFMEMNTRLQVEHPVTEMITGQDLVEWQLRVAAGERLPRSQDQLSIHGHSLEARLYAEDPGREFLPSTGRLGHLRFPPQSLDVRVDTGVAQGDEITPHYDPMIAKLIVWGENRERACARMLRALREVQIVGVAHNVPFLSKLVASPSFAAADLDTALIEREAAWLFAPAEQTPPQVLAIAALAEVLREAQLASSVAQDDPHSPWNRHDGWRLGGRLTRRVVFRAGEGERTISVTYGDGQYRLAIDGVAFAGRGKLADDGTIAAEIDNARLSAVFIADGETRHLFLHGQTYRFSLPTQASGAAEDTSRANLTAPMPGKIIALLAEPGPLLRGAPMLVLEAMKMEHTVNAPADGELKRFRCAVGDQVAAGADLVEFEAAPDAA